MTSARSSLRPVAGLAEFIRGAVELEITEHGLLPHRLPAAARARSTDPQLAMVEVQSAGVRLAFRSESTVLELDVVRTRVALRGMPARSDGRIDLVVDGEVIAGATTSAGRTTTIEMSTGDAEVEDEGPCTVRFDGLPSRPKEIEIWLPHNEQVELVALRTDAPVLSASGSDRPVWVHHGSSISQGSNAVRPTGTWPVIAARSTDAELVDMGFGGSALLDPFVARSIGAAPADVISVAIGINLVNSDAMRMRAFGPAVHGFLDTIRDTHPDTPILVVSPVFCPIHEDTPGPSAFDLDALAAGTIRFRATGDPADAAGGKLTLRTIRAELARIVAGRRALDPQLHLVDGLDLYGPADADEHPLPDALHPDNETHRLIGERFARIITPSLSGLRRADKEAQRVPAESPIGSPALASAARPLRGAADQESS